MTFLSLAPLTVGNLGPIATIDAAFGTGFDGVGLRLVAAPGTVPADPVIGNPPLIGEIARRLAASGLTAFAATGLWLEADTVVQGFLPALETAARFGVRYVLTVGNDTDAGRLAENFARLGAAAASFGLALALEFMPAARVNSLAVADRLLRRAAVANAGILVDALHLARSGGAPADVAALPPGRVAYLQLCDAPSIAPPATALRGEALTGRLYPGEGGLPLAALLEALPETIPVDVETPVAADAHLAVAARASRSAAAARRFLEAWGAGRQRAN